MTRSSGLPVSRHRCPELLTGPHADGYVLLDGTVAETDQLNAEGHFSGKVRREGMNLQVIAADDGKLLWLSPAPPGGTHDVKAAGNTASSTSAHSWTSRFSLTGTTSALAVRPVLATSPTVCGAGARVRTPGQQPLRTSRAPPQTRPRPDTASSWGRTRLRPADVWADPGQNPPDQPDSSAGHTVHI